MFALNQTVYLIDSHNIIIPVVIEEIERYYSDTIEKTTIRKTINNDGIKLFHYKHGEINELPKSKKDKI